MKPLPPLLLLLALLVGCTSAEPVAVIHTPTALQSEDPSPDWWQDAVFYEIFVRSFFDSDGDGIGDFSGLTEKLDYLNDGNPATTGDLGITGIWLMPIHPSPSYHGYDVTNYYAVNPQYGSMQDFRIFLAQAHARGIRVIMDLVLNHTSSQHPFFRDALRGSASPYQDWYLWSSNGGTNWHPAGDAFYYGLFCDCMPDLNYNHPEVTVQMQQVMRFWLQDVGVDGFRVDAARHLIEQDGQTENTPATHDWYRQNFFPMYKQTDPQAYTVGEVYGAGATMVRSYTGDQLDHVFNFEMASGFVNSAAGASNTGVTSAIKFSLQDMPDFNFATFLTNHDQNRVMSVLNGDAGKARVAASMLLTSPGTPFIYYGEEIGMQGKKPDEDIRLPMQWSSASNAGFTTGTPWRQPGADFHTVNVASQDADPHSLLSHYRSLLGLRSLHPALRSSGLWLVDAGRREIYAVLRIQNDDMILVLVNLGNEPITSYSLQSKDSPLPEGGYSLETLMGDVSMPEMIFDSTSTMSFASPLPPLPDHSTWIFQLHPR